MSLLQAASVSSRRRTAAAPVSWDLTQVGAASAGQTLSDYLLAEIERLAARPTREEMLARIHGRKRVTLKTPAAVIIRAERESA